MREQHLLGAALLDGIDECWPIGVIREHEAAIVATASARTSNSHPARAKAGRCIAETAHPRRACGARRSNDQRAFVIGPLLAHYRLRGEHCHAGSPIFFNKSGHGAVQINRFLCVGEKLREHALSFAQPRDVAGDRILVDWAMRYGKPEVRTRIQALLAGVEPSLRLFPGEL